MVASARCHLSVKSPNRELSDDIGGGRIAAQPSSLVQTVSAWQSACPAFNPSRASRVAVRTSAAASDAFFARADRSSAVIFLAGALPPCRPNMRAISVMAARTSGGIFIRSMVHLTGYGEHTAAAMVVSASMPNLQAHRSRLGGPGHANVLERRFYPISAYETRKLP